MDVDDKSDGGDNSEYGGGICCIPPPSSPVGLGSPERKHPVSCFFPDAQLLFSEVGLRERRLEESTSQAFRNASFCLPSALESIQEDQVGRPGRSLEESPPPVFRHSGFFLPTPLETIQENQGERCLGRSDLCSSSHLETIPEHKEMMKFRRGDLMLHCTQRRRLYNRPGHWKRSKQSWLLECNRICSTERKLEKKLPSLQDIARKFRSLEM